MKVKILEFNGGKEEDRAKIIENTINARLKELGANINLNDCTQSESENQNLLNTLKIIISLWYETGQHIGFKRLIQVKVFRNNDMGKLELEMNTWLSKNKIKPIQKTQSQGTSHATFLIFYKIKEEK
ncbi:MAG: hypothetical protein GQ527_03650 [Bacteroidales bacterium]|nr:hypothetical protein [Bacteroidales bacterium]